MVVFYFIRVLIISPGRFFENLDGYTKISLSIHNSFLEISTAVENSSEQSESP
jgi:hypothetical protein